MKVEMSVPGGFPATWTVPSTRWSREEVRVAKAAKDSILGTST